MLLTGARLRGILSQEARRPRNLATRLRPASGSRMAMPLALTATADDATTSELIRRAASSDEAAMRTIMRRYNRRLYHLARSVLKDDDDAEDAVQQAYLKAFAGIAKFREEAELGTWLSRIVINAALDMRSRR